MYHDDDDDDNDKYSKKYHIHDDDNGNDNDDDFLVISSKKQRLHSLLEEDDDDDIIVLRSVPKTSTTTTTATAITNVQNKRETNGFLFKNDNNNNNNINNTSMIVTVLVILLSSLLLYYHWSRQTTKEAYRPKSSYQKTQPTTPKRKKTQETQQQQQQEEEEDEEEIDINPRTTKKCKQSPNNNGNAITTTTTTGDDPDRKPQSKPYLSLSSSPLGGNNHNNNENDNENVENSVYPGLVEEEESLQFMAKSSKMRDLNGNETLEFLSLQEKTTTTTMTTTSTSPSQSTFENNRHSTDICSRQEKLNIARKIAQDIKLVEDVLKQEGIGNSDGDSNKNNNHHHQALAAQVAIGWHSSERIIHSQRETEIRRMVLDTHHRNLDRQLSQRQHEETLQAATYDPNWKEKLQQKRDDCWNLVCQLLWEVGLVYQGDRLLVMPILHIWKSQQPEISVTRIVELVVDNLCGCQSSQAPVTPSTGLMSSWSSLSYATTLYSYLGLDTFLGVSMCYGYCLSCIVFAFISIALLHRCLTLLAAPAILHHLINASALLFFIKPSFSLSGNISFSILSDPQLSTLVVSVLGIFAVVQWNYWTCQQRIIQRLRTDFQNSLEKSLDRMDWLHGMLKLFRCIILGMCVYYSSIVDNLLLEPTAQPASSDNEMIVLV